MLYAMIGFPQNSLMFLGKIPSLFLCSAECYLVCWGWSVSLWGWMRMVSLEWRRHYLGFIHRSVLKFPDQQKLGRSCIPSVFYWWCGGLYFGWIGSVSTLRCSIFLALFSSRECSWWYLPIVLDAEGRSTRRDISPGRLWIRCREVRWAAAMCTPQGTYCLLLFYKISAM